VKELGKKIKENRNLNYSDLKEWCSFIYVASTQQDGAAALDEAGQASSAGGLRGRARSSGGSSCGSWGWWLSQPRALIAVLLPGASAFDREPGFISVC